jgi:hypothetical protein
MSLQKSLLEELMDEERSLPMIHRGGYKVASSVQIV